MNMIKRQIERIIRIFRILVFATYSLQFMEFGRKYFVMSKKNSTFVAERRLPWNYKFLGRRNIEKQYKRKY